MRTMRSAKLSGRRAGSRGITSMEILVGSALSLVVMSAFASFFEAQTRAHATMSTYAASQNVTRVAADLMAREIRMASFDPTDMALTDSPGPTCPSVKEGIALAMPQLIWIQQDLDADGLLISAGESLIYSRDGTTITRWDLVGPTPTTLVDGVPPAGFGLRYFDGSNPPIELVPSGSPQQLTQSQRACVEKVLIEVNSLIPDPRPDRPDLHSSVQTGVAIRSRALGKY